MLWKVGINQLRAFVIEGEAYGVTNKAWTRPVEHYSVLVGSYSTVARSHDTSFWVKGEGGVESQVVFGANVPARDGHFMSTLYVGREETGKGLPVAIYNRNTKSIIRLTAGEVYQLLELEPNAPFGCLGFSLALLCIPSFPIVGYNMFRPAELSGWIGFLLAVSLTVLSIVRSKRWMRRRLSQLDSDLMSQMTESFKLGSSVPADVDVRVVI